MRGKCRRPSTVQRRPILGFIKQYQERFLGLQRQIDIALRVFAEAEDLKGISLMLWLGADPYADTPSTAYEDSKYGSVDDNAFERAVVRRIEHIVVFSNEQNLDRLSSEVSDKKRSRTNT